ncbi:MAG TPA: hypothetical protein VHG09_08235 [Longimicrobiales bacterium]|nr:hypothetical protein [Longimicrobiales bacterium]
MQTTVNETIRRFAAAVELFDRSGLQLTAEPLRLAAIITPRPGG